MLLCLQRCLAPLGRFCVGAVGKVLERPQSRSYLVLKKASLQNPDTRAALCFRTPGPCQHSAATPAIACKSREYADDPSRSSQSKENEERKLRDSFRENVGTVPNLLTGIRIMLSPVLGYLVVQETYPLALGLFVCAGLTDVMDGHIARLYPSQRSVLGSVLDPLADKLLVSILAITLTSVHLIPVPLMLLILTRDVGLVIASFYVRYLSLPPPKTFARFFDLTHATASVHPSLLSKINTAVQLLLLAATLSAPVFGFVDHPFLKFLWVACGLTTVLSGVSYATSTSAFKILTRR